ncbi:SPOC domain-like protein [Mollisia scopiformis]|uniref:ATP-dependent DNA helicase II subunit 2 n=1 Tax=Mollisia scopiformis TaxID=149040 RepID=A0A194XMH0_MOLSC|nr:SPOC domain-like protein [Mollisia scopiformis]KUJ20967.1 SPOC domain-like protein [Mollisia scopiformis]
MSKEATVFVLDLGSTMGDCHNGRVESDLDYAMRYVYDKMADTMSSTRTTLNTGVIGFRTNVTNNPLDDGDEGYNNISVLQPLGTLTMPLFNDLKAKITPSQTEAGDAISAIVVAVHMIEKYTMLKSGKPGSYVRKIILVTDGQGRMDDELLDDIATKINQMGIHLTVMGVDFDDADFGFKEEDKSIIKQENEKLTRGFVEKCNNDSIVATAAEVIESLSTPKVKEVKSIPVYQGRLCLGDPEKYPETAMYIDVKRSFFTKAARPVSAKSVVIPLGAASTQSSHTLPGDVEMTDAPPTGDASDVRTGRSYKVKDPTSDLGEKFVDYEDLQKGYGYGRTAVPISASDENVTKLETFQSFSIIGFIPTDKYEQYFTMGESGITIAQQVNDKARVALSSLVHALFELESYAVARLVSKDGKDPQILLLAPYIENHLEALIDVPLPFAEDIRMYRFPPLDRVITASGATLETHRYLPSSDLDDAMSEYVDSMDLSTFDKDDEGNPTEYMKIEDTYSPIVHRILQAIRQRAIYGGPVEPPAEILTKWSEPPAELAMKSTGRLEKLISVADVRKVPPKVKGTRGRREVIAPLSGLDIESLLVKNKPNKISKENAIPDFRQMLAAADKDETISDAVKGMSEVIKDLLQVTGDANDQRCQENIKVVREEMIDYEFPEFYNNFIRDLKKRVFKKEFGNKREFWQTIRLAKLGLIDSTIISTSDVSPEEATEFLSIPTELPTRRRES